VEVKNPTVFSTLGLDLPVVRNCMTISGAMHQRNMAAAYAVSALNGSVVCFLLHHVSHSFFSEDSILI